MNGKDDHDKNVSTVHDEHRHQSDLQPSSADLQDADKMVALGEMQASRPVRTPWETMMQHKKLVALILIVQTNAIIVGVQFSLPGNLLGIPAYLKLFGVETSPGVYAVEAKVLTIWAALFATFQVLGQITGGFQSDYFGRRICLYTVIFWTYVGCVCEVVARDWKVWLASKIILGFATGIMQSVVPTFVSEIAPREIRGISLSFFNMCMGFGGLWATLLAFGTQKRWPDIDDERSFRVPLYITLAIPTISLILEIFFLVESPWWLLMRGKRDQAIATLQRLHSREPEYDLDADLAELEYTIQKEAQMEELSKQSSYLECFKGTDLRRTFCAVYPPITQNLGGQNLAGTYQTYFFALAGSTDALRDSIIATVVGLFANFISFFLLENKRFGRWKLLIGGITAMTLCMLGIGLIGVIGNGSYSPAVGGVLVALVAVFLASSTLGPGVTGWAYTGESGSARLRAKTTTLGTMGNAIIGLIMTSVLPYMLNEPSAGGQGWNIKTAWMFFILGSINIVVVYFLIPEYRGRSYAQLDELFARRIPARKFEKTETTGAYGNDLHEMGRVREEGV